MTIAALLQPFSTEQILTCMIVVFLTAIMRGYTGFGFALVAVPLLAVIADPVIAVPMVLLLEVVGSLQLLPGLWRSAHLRSVMLLVAGALLATPIGLYGLAALPADLGGVFHDVRVGKLVHVGSASSCPRPAAPWSRMGPSCRSVEDEGCWRRERRRKGEDDVRGRRPG